MKNSSSTSEQAFRIVASIFEVRRHLVWLIKKKVLGGLGVTLDQADILLDLYRAMRLDAQPSDLEGGWVTFSALRESFVQDRVLLTRRMKEFEANKWAEFARVSKEEAKAIGMCLNSMKVRIIPEGEAKAKAIYERYGGVCLELLSILPAVREDSMIVLNFNEALIKALGWRHSL